MMTMLLQGLPFTFDSGAVQNKNEMWKERFQRRRGGPKVVGMGLAATIRATGYGWLLPRIDWEQLTFRPRFAEEMAFCQSMLRDSYRKNWASVKDAKDDISRLEAANRWLLLYGEYDSCRRWITEFMVLLLMQAYRRYCFGCLKSVIRPEHYQAALQGEFMFCSTDISRLIGPEAFQNIHLVHPDRVQNNSTHSSIHSLLVLIWGVDPNIYRARWEHAPFRLLCRRAIEIITNTFTPAEGLLFHDLVFRYFIATHWLIPSPARTRFIVKTKRREIQWIGIYHRAIAYWSSNRMPIANVEDLLPTTLPQPTQWQPESYPWDDSRNSDSENRTSGANGIPENNQYMRDWDFIPDKKVPFMPCYPQDYLSNSPRFDADLVEITKALDLKWQVWKQGSNDARD
jgi:hypothetical protein